jgi:hypothetical protein
MRRMLSAWREWLQLRARLREERQFHLDRAAAEFRSRGLAARDANRAARIRFGSRANLEAAAHELGSDLPGLAHLFRVHRVLASAWLQPAVLFVVAALVLLLSPAPRQIVGDVVVRLHEVQVPGAVSLSVEGRSPWSGGGITPPEWEGLRSMTTLTEVRRDRGLYAWGRATPGATLEAIQSEARAKTGNAAFVVNAISPHWEIVASPAQSVWATVAIYGAFFLFRYARQFGASHRLLRRWLFYGAGVAALHAMASLAAFAFVIQMWSRTGLAFGAGGVTFVLLFGMYLGVVAIQCRYWWADLRQRCPICFDRLVLPLTEGAAESVLFSPAVTESVCAHGHGVLVESRWRRAFRTEESPLQSLVHF